MVSDLSSCNSIICIDNEVEKLEKDSLIKILPINWKFFSDIKKDFLTHE
jgi:molybdopterin molybdotransferase